MVYKSLLQNLPCYKRSATHITIYEWQTFSLWPIRPAGEIYNAKPSKLLRGGLKQHAKPLTSLVRTAEGSSVRGAVARSAFWMPADPKEIMCSTLEGASTVATVSDHARE